jgi:hypothetical protein
MFYCIFLTDTEHSLNTLRHACIMHGQQDGGGQSEETRFVTGGSVKVQQIGEKRRYFCHAV